MIETALAPLVVRVALPRNITRITTQADLYSYGVRLLRFVQVADELEAVQVAGIERAYLLKSNTLPCYYLIFPVAVVTPAPPELNEKQRQKGTSKHDTA